MKTRTNALTQSRKAAAGIDGRLRKLAERIGIIRSASRRFEAASLRLCVKFAALCVLCASAGVVGCDSTDGDFHTPVTGMSIEKAYRIAGEAGYIRQETKLGGRWMHVVQLETLGLGPKSMMALNGPPLLDAQLKQSAVFESLGRTDQQMRRAYNAAGIAWAKVGDGAIATAVASAVVAGVVALTDGDSGGGSSADTAAKGGQQATGRTVNQINNSPGASINNDGGEGGQSGGGSGGAGAEPK